ncbi:MAG TPA: carboxypeptidase regulatory-like domain-containing protein, partial [Candidatus Ozemobacteraceae bacterium]|nr:carboxypeptidase regulatory-like domain-containing protein [Candidatus Ozemobacteraceae bacterium]
MMFRSAVIRRFRAAPLVVAFLLLGLMGCGLREPQTGSLSGRVFNVKGEIVENAKVYSLFNEVEQVYTGNDGSFYLSELPSGRNTIVITHPTYRIESRVVEIPPSTNVAYDEIKLDWATSSQQLSALVIERTASTTADISWKTYKPATTILEWGLTQSYGNTYTEREAVTDHRYTITGLAPDTVYHVRAKLFDDNNNAWFSYDMPFKTTQGPIPAAPVDVRIQPLAAFGVVDLEWDLSTSTAVVGYRVWRREKDTDWTLLTTDLLDRNTRTYADVGARGGRFYEYAVEAWSLESAVSPRVYSRRVFMPGYINDLVTLTASDSPVLLEADLIVGLAGNLQVGPGVEFRVAASDAFSLGTDRTRVEMLVQGRVTLAGTAADPVRFTPADSSGGRTHWAGIVLQNGGTGFSEIGFVQLSGCTPYALWAKGTTPNLHDISVRYAQGGMYFEDIRALPTLTGCRFDDIASSALTVVNCRRFDVRDAEITESTIGMVFQAGTTEDYVTVRECRIEALQEGIRGAFQRSVLKNLLILVPDGIGIRVQSVPLSQNYIDHVTVDADVGIQLENGVPLIENSIIVNTLQEGTVGVRSLTAGNPQFDYINVFGFAAPYENGSGGVGARTEQPAFLGGNPYNYELQLTSMLKRTDRYGQE